MTISLTEDFKTVDELRNNPDSILEHVQRTGRPLVITVAGKPGAVVLDVAAYERLVHTLNLSRLLAEAGEDVRAGRTQPLDEFMKEFERDHQLPRRNRRQRPA